MIIDILGDIWTIEMCSANDPKLFVNGGTCRGATWCGHQHIFLSDELDTHTASRVITHELSHAFLWSTQMKLEDSYSEEDLCNFVAIYGDQIMKTTKFVFKELFTGGAQ